MYICYYCCAATVAISFVAFILSVGQFGIEIETMQKRGEWSPYYTYDSLIFCSLSLFIVCNLLLCRCWWWSKMRWRYRDIGTWQYTYRYKNVLFFVRKKGTHKMEKTKHTHTHMHILSLSRYNHSNCFRMQKKEKQQLQQKGKCNKRKITTTTITKK